MRYQVHILIFTSQYTRSDPVASRPFVHQQALALARTHRVTVVAPKFARLTELFERLCVVATEDTGVVYRPRCWYVKGIWWLFYTLTCFWCTRKINWDTVDVVHAHFSIPAGFAAALLSHWHRKPFVLTEHWGQFGAVVSSPVRRQTIHWTIKQAQRVLVVSRALQRDIEAQGMTAHFVVVPNVVDPKTFYPVSQSVNRASGPIHLLWVGGFRPDYYVRKGGPELLRAIALARPRLPEGTRVTLVGDGSARAESQASAQLLGIADVCDFVGALPHTQVRDWMQRCDALVLSSLSESFGVVLIEAMACGKPVIATRCGGPEEIVVPEVGILVEPGNAQALADGIVRLVENYESFDPAQIAAYACTHFNPERVAGMLTRVYIEVCGISGSGCAPTHKLLL